MEGQHVVHGRDVAHVLGGQTDGLGEFRRGIDGEARAVQRGVERHVTRGHSARRGVTDHLAEAEILEVIAGIGLGHDDVPQLAMRWPVMLSVSEASFSPRQQPIMGERSFGYASG
jgi:hypothetical protein